jgi:hypothetical protein
MILVWGRRTPNSKRRKERVCFIFGYVLSYRYVTLLRGVTWWAWWGWAKPTTLNTSSYKDCPSTTWFTSSKVFSAFLWSQSKIRSSLQVWLRVEQWPLACCSQVRIYSGLVQHKNLECRNRLRASPRWNSEFTPGSTSGSTWCVHWLDLRWTYKSYLFFLEGAPTPKLKLLLFLSPPLLSLLCPLDLPFAPTKPWFFGESREEVLLYVSTEPKVILPLSSSSYLLLLGFIGKP